MGSVTQKMFMTKKVQTFDTVLETIPSKMSFSPMSGRSQDGSRPSCAEKDTIKSTPRKRKVT